MAQKKRNSAGWLSQLQIARERDHYTCVICGFSRVINVHHILSVANGGDHALTNLVTLCPNDHGLADRGVHTQEKLRALVAKVSGSAMVLSFQALSRRRSRRKGAGSPNLANIEGEAPNAQMPVNMPLKAPQFNNTDGNSKPVEAKTKHLPPQPAPECNKMPVLLKSKPKTETPAAVRKARAVLAAHRQTCEAQARKTPPPPAFLTQAEIERLLGAISSPRDRAIFSIAYHRGLRASEIGMLEMRDYTPPTINARVGTLYCRRLKDSLSKIYDLTKGEEKELRAWFRVRGKQPGLIFSSRQGGPIDRTTLHKLMRRYGAAAGIKQDLCHFHTLKHTCAVSLLQQGMGVDQVQSWLGHRSIQSTMIYLRVVDIRLKDAAQKLVNWR